MISEQDPRPAYRQVADAIRADIEAGVLAAGDTLPSVTALERQYDVSKSTVQRAISHLRGLGLIETRSGSGTFVRRDRPWTAISQEWWKVPSEGESDHWTTATRAHGFTGNQDLVHVGAVEPPQHVRDALGIDDTTVIVRDRILKLDGEPMQLVQSWFPHSVADGTPLTEPQKIKGGTPRILGAMTDPPVEILKETVARMPTQAERQALELPEGVPVLDITMIAITATGRPVEVGTMVARGDRHRMRDRHPA